MQYLAIGVVALFVLYKILVYFGRKNAIEVLCHNYGLNREKVKSLEDKEITLLHITLESYRKRGDSSSMEMLSEKFR